MEELRMGMIGGGPGSMIGEIHLKASAAKKKARLVCGAFSSNAEKSRIKGKELGLPADRIYESFQQMISKEAQLPENKRMHYCSITTPNHLHFEPARLALENGFHVMCDKPFTFTLQQAKDLHELAKQKKLLVGITYTYRGYEMIKKAQDLIQKGYLGEIRKIKVDYTQGWLSNLIEAEDHKQASWRTDPKQSGSGGTIADIGTHAFDLLESISSLKADSMVAQLSTLVEGRKIDDDANILMKLENDAAAVITVGQACPGEGNDLSVKIYGEKAGLIWHHEKPDELTIKHLNGEVESLKTVSKADEQAENNILPGHSADFVQAFISLYDDFNGKLFDILHHPEYFPEKSFNLPDSYDGMRGMLFIEKAIESSKNGKWVSFSD